MKTTLKAVALGMMMATAAMAQPKPDVVILPVEMPGYYTPVDSEKLAKELEADLHKMASGAVLQPSRAADLTTYGYTAGGEQPPATAMADKICRAYGASHICWVSIRFQPDYQAQTGALALGGAARFWVYSAEKHSVTIDQPISLVRVGHVADIKNATAARAEAEKLADGCISDLAYQITSIARRSAAAPAASVQQWSAPKSDATGSANYKAMLSATTAYQKAVKKQSLVDITETQAAMTRAWQTLNQAERTAISKNYPDLEAAMTATPIYNYGGYWPY